MGLSRPKKYEKWEMCDKCLGKGDGKILMKGTTRGRWKVKCVNVNNAVGQLIGCTGVVRAESSGEGWKMCVTCWLWRDRPQIVQQVKWALNRSFYGR